jgi:nitrogen regulatory protein PII
MHTSPLKVVTIVGETILAEHLHQDLRRLGATGWTQTDALGEGSRGMRAKTLRGDNMRLEVVVSPEVADAILERLAQEYFPNYALVAWVADVQVVRGEKYR